ncbi:unnamed protein product [Moneuplotes crassus]|uniref:Uncharacterized protein n=1 Tax=Euplotes crassus TaxID=5936 RepID=A0AAD2D8S3_EUPCR|nr:unnamed protein product [Moneuplotes crassus]
MPDKGGKTASTRINLVVSRKEKRKSILSNKNSPRKIQSKKRLLIRISQLSILSKSTEPAQKRDFREKKTQMKNKLKSIHSRKGSMILKHNKSEPKDASLLILEG